MATLKEILYAVREIEGDLNEEDAAIFSAGLAFGRAMLTKGKDQIPLLDEGINLIHQSTGFEKSWLEEALGIE